MEVLFARVGVADFPAALGWYSRLFGRDSDVIAHDREVMWRIADGGWLYVLEDNEHSGWSEVTISVSDLAETLRELATRDIKSGPIEQVGDNAKKAFVIDPEGNRIAFIQVSPSS